MTLAFQRCRPNGLAPTRLVRHRWLLLAICAALSAAPLFALAGGPPKCPCPFGGFQEPESCGSAENNGECPEPAVTLAECGQTRCGTVFADGGERDIDTYHLTDIPDADGDGFALITASLSSQFSGNAFIMAADCSETQLGQFGYGVFCESVTPAQAVVAAPGEVFIYIMPGNEDGTGIFDGIPCGSMDAAYRMAITCGDAQCLSDLNFDGDVGPADLAALLDAWSTAPPGPPDLNSDGDVGPADLAQLLDNWGPCP